MSAVTFDFGQTLAVLDTVFLSQRLAERGCHLAPAALVDALAGGWVAYDRAIAQGVSGHPWEVFMSTVLAGAGAEPARADALAAWLFAEQPAANLWREPVPGMIELVRELAAAQHRVGVISNSEGRLASLAVQLGWGDDFECISDSGAMGCEKPGAEIFERTARTLEVSLSELVHVGDSLQADVYGALNAGASAVWFVSATEPWPGGLAAEPRVRRAHDAAAVRAALESLGVSLHPG